MKDALAGDGSDDRGVGRHGSSTAERVRRPSAKARSRALAAGQGRGRRLKAAGFAGAAVAGDGGGAGTGPEASRSAKRTLDAPLAKYPVGRGSAVAASDRRRGLGVAGISLAYRLRPPIPAPRRGRGSGGWPPAAAFGHGRRRCRSAGGADGGHAVADAAEQRAALGLDAAGGLQVGLRGGDRV